MARKKTGESRGRKSDFTGEKKDWLNTFRDQLRDAGKDPGSVYSDATKAFIMRYGYDLPFSDNVDGDPEEQPPKLRLQLFSQSLEGQEGHSAAIAGILGAMQTMSGPGSRPRRKPNLAVYSKLQYATRVKPQFDLVWANAKKTTPWTERVSMSQDYTRACWEKESPEFKAEIEAEGIKMHQADLEQWKASRKIPEGSAEEYHKYVTLEERQEIDPPSSSAMDSLNERLGSHVVILVVGPVGSEKGEVCLRTVFSDTSNLQTSRTWAQFDHGGFTAMENSITCYGRAAFSKAECRERAWPPLEDGPPSVPDGLLSIDHTAPQDTTPPVVPPATVPPGPAAPIANITSIPASTIPTPNPAPQTADDDGIDRTGWSQSLIETHAYLATKNWVPRWTALLDALVAHEWSWFHVDEEGKLPKLKSRPEEFADWMKEHRPCKDYPVGTDFGDQLLDWWKDLGVRGRWTGVEKLHKQGRNGAGPPGLGPCLVRQNICNRAVADGIGADEAALAASKPFQLLVDDVTWVLKDVLTQDRPAAEEWLADKARREREEEDDTEEMGNATEKGGEDGHVAPDKAKKTTTKKPTKAVKGQPVAASKKRHFRGLLIRRCRCYTPLPPPEKSQNVAPNSGDISAASSSGAVVVTPLPPPSRPAEKSKDVAGSSSAAVVGAPLPPPFSPVEKSVAATVVTPLPLPSLPAEKLDVESAAAIDVAATSEAEVAPVMATPLMGTHPNPEINTDTAGHFQERESLDSDPFAGGIGLTAEELAEMALDPDADNDAFDGDDMDTD
ncbi:hypothetical protein B0H14DRAFT_3496883 [Mycena olivaceomarginata]|nr:hypothetical protein B0H14DRAFT_3496883 [Mycena olivaceomarginata]